MAFGSSLSALILAMVVAAFLAAFFAGNTMSGAFGNNITGATFFATFVVLLWLFVRLLKRAKQLDWRRTVRGAADALWRTTKGFLLTAGLIALTLAGCVSVQVSMSELGPLATGFALACVVLTLRHIRRATLPTLSPP